MSLIQVVHLDLQISPQIFEKIRNDTNATYYQRIGEDNHEKNRSKKSRGTVPLMTDRGEGDDKGEKGVGRVWGGRDGKGGKGVGRDWRGRGWTDGVGLSVEG